MTANNGDGTTCTGVQNSGTNVNFTLTCVAMFQGKPTGVYHIYEGGSAQVKVPGAHTVSLGDVLCLFGSNPTNFAVTFPLLPPTPAHSLAYDCAVNLRNANVVVGNAPGVSGVVTWTALTQRSFLYRLFHPRS